MKPVVNLYKLGRVPYVKALNIQQVLFDKLKNDVNLQWNRKDNNINNNNYNNNNNNNINNYNYGFKQQAKLETVCLSKSEHDSKNGGGDGDYGCSEPKPVNEVVYGNSLILVEHEPVYTIGIRSNSYDDKYVSKLKEKLDEHKLKADFVKTNRGGLITFHGPGQLVAYPIIYLGDFAKTIPNRSVKSYVNLLEATIIDTLAKVSILGAHTVRKYPGVWLANGERKIAFIGIACKRFVTMHGISINCNCHLSWFDLIVSCGIEDKSITSVQQELLTNCLPPTETAIQSSKVENISKEFCRSFSQHFDCILEEKPSLDLHQHHHHQSSTQDTHDR